MKNIYCIGELLIDLVSTDGENYIKKPGGAPANVAVAASKLGAKSFFLGQVGNDTFGRFLESTLEENKVDTTLMDMGGKTTLAIVTLDKSGERSFEFFRGSDSEYDIDLSKMQINKGDIVHFGSATGFLGSKLQDSYYKLLELCEKQEAFISFDPNYRDVLISNDYMDEYKEHCLYFMKKADFTKLSDEEAMLLTNTNTLEESVEKLKSLNLKTIAITLGKEGTMIIENKQTSIIDSISINQKDSTGAGDAFVGGVLYGLALGKTNDFGKIIRFGNIVGAITCEEYGAIPSIPDMQKLAARNYDRFIPID